MVLLTNLFSSSLLTFYNGVGVSHFWMKYTGINFNHGPVILNKPYSLMGNAALRKLKSGKVLKYRLNPIEYYFLTLLAWPVLPRKSQMFKGETFEGGPWIIKCDNLASHTDTETYEAFGRVEMRQGVAICPRTI